LKKLVYIWFQMGATAGCMPARANACDNRLVTNPTERASWCTNEPCIIKPEDANWLSSFKNEWKDDEELSIVVTESINTYNFSKDGVDDNTKAESLYYPHSDCDSVESTEDYPKDRSQRKTSQADSKSLSISWVSSRSRLSQPRKGVTVLWSPKSINSQSSSTQMHIMRPKSLWSLGNDVRFIDSSSDSIIGCGEDIRAKRFPLQLNKIQGETSCKSGRDTYCDITPLREIHTYTKKKRNIHFSEKYGTCLLSLEERKNPQKFFEKILSMLEEGPNCFDTLDTLEFDVMRVSELPKPFNSMPLATTTVVVLHRLNTVENLKISWFPIIRFLMRLEEAYYDHPYHSGWHAADVVATMAYFMSRGWFIKTLNPVHQITGLLAAASHDVGHDALSNKYHKLVKSPIGTVYASSNLEHYHIKKATEIRNIPECDWTTSLQNYDRAYTPEKVWELFSNMILATDLSFHFPQKRTPFARLADSTEVLMSPVQEYALVEILHLADISNAVKPRGIATKWAGRFYQEFTELGKEVRKLGLDIPIHKDPLKTPTLPETQIFFISNMVQHVFEDLVSFMPEVQETLDNLHSNLKYWKMVKEGTLLSIKLADLEMDASHDAQRASQLVGKLTPNLLDSDMDSASIIFESSNLGLPPSSSEK